MNDKPNPVNDDDTTPEQELSTRTLFIAGAGFLAMLTALYGFTQAVDVEQLRLMVAGAGLWGPFLYVGLKALTFTFAPLSAGPVQFASGIIFGVIPGTFYSVLGEVVGGTVSVIIARLFGRRIVKKLVGESALSRVDAFYEKYVDDWRSLLMARLLLFSVYDFISYAVGLGKIRYSTYILVSFFGGLIPTYIFVLIGAEAAQNQNVLLVFYGVVALMIAAYIVFRGPLSKLISRLKDSL